MKYTEADIEYIRLHYPTEDTKAVADHLGRTEKAIRCIAMKKGINKQLIDKDYVVNYAITHKDQTYEEMSKVLGMSKNTIANYVAKKGEKKNNNWSQEEIDYLKRNYFKGDIEEIATYLGRSKKAVSMKAFKLGINSGISFSEEEKAYIHKYYKRYTQEQIAKKLGRTKASINAYCIRNGLKKKEWTEKELTYLRNNFGVLRLDVMERSLKRKRNSILSMANRKGLGSIRDNMIDLTASEVGRMIGKHRSYISKLCTEGRIKGVKRDSYWHISEDDLIRYMREHPKEWKALDCEKEYFQRFDWFMKKYNDESEQKRRDRWGQWYA